MLKGRRLWQSSRAANERERRPRRFRRPKNERRRTWTWEWRAGVRACVPRGGRVKRRTGERPDGLCCGDVVVSNGGIGRCAQGPSKRGPRLLNFFVLSPRPNPPALSRKKKNACSNGTALRLAAGYRIGPSRRANSLLRRDCGRQAKRDTSRTGSGKGAAAGRAQPQGATGERTRFRPAQPELSLLPGLSCPRPLPMRMPRPWPELASPSLPACAKHGDLQAKGPPMGGSDKICPVLPHPRKDGAQQV